MATGTIKAIERFRAKGFGFITPSQGGEDVFFHFSGVTGWNDGYTNLHEGDVVTYEIATGRDGKTKAVSVTFASPAAANDDVYGSSAANDDVYGEDDQMAA